MKYGIILLAVTFSCAFHSSLTEDQSVVIYERSTKITRADIRRDATSQENTIEIEALNITGGSISLQRQNPVHPPAEISSIISINGSYLMSRDLRKSGRGVVMQLLNVVYPYRGRLTISEEIFEFEIRQPGYWKINIALAQ